MNGNPQPDDPLDTYRETDLVWLTCEAQKRKYQRNVKESKSLSEVFSVISTYLPYAFMHSLCTSCGHADRYLNQTLDTWRDSIVEANPIINRVTILNYSSSSTKVVLMVTVQYESSEFISTIMCLFHVVSTLLSLPCETVVHKRTIFTGGLTTGCILEIETSKLPKFDSKSFEEMKTMMRIAGSHEFNLRD